MVLGVGRPAVAAAAPSLEGDDGSISSSLIFLPCLPRLMTLEGKNVQIQLLPKNYEKIEFCVIFSMGFNILVLILS